MLLQAVEEYMQKIRRWTVSAARLFALIGFCGLFVLAVMTGADVFLRWLFNSPIAGVNDVSAIVMAAVIAACIPANLSLKQNLKVEILGGLLPARAARFFDLLGSILTLVFVVIIAWQMVLYADSMRISGERTWVLALPVWPWWAFSSVMLIFGSFAQLIVTLTDLLALFSPQAAPDEVVNDDPSLI